MPPASSNSATSVATGRSNFPLHSRGSEGAGRRAGGGERGPRAFELQLPVAVMRRVGLVVDVGNGGHWRPFICKILPAAACIILLIQPRGQEVVCKFSMRLTSLRSRLKVSCSGCALVSICRSAFE